MTVSTTSLDRAVTHLLSYLNDGETECIFVFEPAYRRIAERIMACSSLTSCIDIEETPEAAIRDAIAGRAACLAFDRRYGPIRPPWQPLFVELARERTESTFTLCDCAHLFDSIFEVAPQEIVELNTRLRERMITAESMHVADAHGTDLTIEFDPRHSWVSIDGFEERRHNLTVNLPPGEIATHPGAVNGTIAFVGGLLGTIPIGRKYGMITAPIRLDVQQGEVRVIDCPNARLAKDLNFCLGHDSGANGIHEIGLGTHPRIIELAGLNYSWEEKHYGFHVGVGASLAQQDGAERVTNHHLDFLFDQVDLTIDGAPLLAQPGEYWA